MPKPYAQRVERPTNRAFSRRELADERPIPGDSFTYLSQDERDRIIETAIQQHRANQREDEGR